MPLTACTIQQVLATDNPNEGRVKINQNFQCLSNNISGSTSNSGNRWYIPFGETVNIASTYQGFLYGDLVIDGTINLETDGQLVIINGDIIATGGTITGAGTIYALDLPTFDTYIISGTYSNGTAVFTNNAGDTFLVTGFTSFDTYVTGGTYSNGTAIFTNNVGNTFEVTGFTIFDTYVTGGTYSNGTTIFTDNTGDTFEVTGYTTPTTIFYDDYSLFPISGTEGFIYVDNSLSIGYLWNLTADTYSNIGGSGSTSPSLLWFAEPSYAPPIPPSVLGADSIAVGNNSQALSDYVFSIGSDAGFQSTGVTYSNFLGTNAGYQATDSTNSNFLGFNAGYQATNSSQSNFLGNNSGYQASGSGQSNFIGNQAGYLSIGSKYSNFLGFSAGYQATGSSYSNFLGYNAGRSFVGNSLGLNNIIIGTNISLSGSTSNAMNIGGVLFGSGLYSSVAGNPSISPIASGRIGIGVVSPLSTFHVNGQSIFSGAGSNVVTIIGSGNTSTLFSVQGSYGELFSITDSLSGSLFSVNDISGLPILEVFDDNTTLMGSFLAPSLNTTIKIAAGIGDTNIYSLIASAYTGAFFEYTASSSGGIRAGSIMSVWSGTSITYTEAPTSSIGITTGITFNMTLGTTATLRASGTTAGWTVKTIVRSI